VQYGRFSGEAASRGPSALADILVFHAISSKRAISANADWPRDSASGRINLIALHAECNYRAFLKGACYVTWHIFNFGAFGRSWGWTPSKIINIVLVSVSSLVFVSAWYLPIRSPAYILRRGFMCSYCMQHAAIVAGFPTWRKACNYCSVLHAIIGCNNCTWNHGITHFVDTSRRVQVDKQWRFKTLRGVRAISLQLITQRHCCSVCVGGKVLLYRYGTFIIH